MYCYQSYAGTEDDVVGLNRSLSNMILLFKPVERPASSQGKW